MSGLEAENAALRERIELLERLESDFERRAAEAEAAPARPPTSADGGTGNAVNANDAPGPESWRPRTFTEQVRDAWLDKRHGERETRNHLLPSGSADPDSPKPDDPITLPPKGDS
jgi:hypothetical protein